MRLPPLPSTRSLLLSLVAMLLATLVTYSVAHAAVTLLYFRATPVANGVALEWETGSELDNIAFVIRRAPSRDGVYQDIVQIPAQSGGIAGAFYRHIDTPPAPGVIYWYKLIDIDVNGNETPHDEFLVSAGVNIATATPTATVAPTSTPTRPPTATRIPSTSTPTTIAADRARRLPHSLRHRSDSDNIHTASNTHPTRGYTPTTCRHTTGNHRPLAHHFPHRQPQRRCAGDRSGRGFTHPYPSPLSPPL